MTDRISGVSRRDFVKQSTALAGVLLTAVAADAAPATSDLDADATRQVASHLTLWYRRPAAQWVEALPVGNGRLGAMVFGGIERERLQLNDDTLWSGGPRDWNNPNAPKVLPRCGGSSPRSKYVEADAQRSGMQGPYTQSYHAAGRSRARVRARRHRARGYRRAARSRSRRSPDVRYRIGDVELRARGVRVASGSGDRRAAHGRHARDDQLHRDARQPAAPRTCSCDGDVLELVGPGAGATSTRATTTAARRRSSIATTRACVRGALRPRHDGGRAWTDRAGLHVRGADEVVLRLDGGDELQRLRQVAGARGKAPGPIAAAQLRAARAKPYRRAARRARRRSPRAVRPRGARARAGHAARDVAAGRCRPTSASTTLGAKDPRSSSCSSSTAATC